MQQDSALLANTGKEIDPGAHGYLFLVGNSGNSDGRNS